MLNNNNITTHNNYSNNQFTVMTLCFLFVVVYGNVTGACYRQFRDQALGEVGVDLSDDQTFKRPGGYDWQHRYTPNTISRAMTRRAHRHRVDTEDTREPTDRSRPRGRYKKRGGNSEGRDKHDKHRHRREGGDGHHHRHHGKHRRHRRRHDIGPNTHVIRGGELETHLLRRLDRWKTPRGGNECTDL